MFVNVKVNVNGNAEGGIRKAESGKRKKTKAMSMKTRKPPGERAAMENLLAKAEWWLERNRQEMPLMGDGKLRKEGENEVLQWVIGILKKDIGVGG